MIIDTDVFIDYLRGVRGTKEWLREITYQERCLSIISHMETLLGCPEKVRRAALRRSIEEDFRRVYPLNQKVSESALHLMERYRPSVELRVGDALIAATCLVYEEPLATWN